MCGDTVHFHTGHSVGYCSAISGTLEANAAGGGGGGRVEAPPPRVHDMEEGGPLPARSMTARGGGPSAAS